jgi:hypothetical protein
VSIKKTLCCAVQTPLPTCHTMPQIHHTRSAIWHFRTSWRPTVWLQQTEKRWNDALEMYLILSQFGK